MNFSVHVTDGVYGQPAAGILIRLDEIRQRGAAQRQNSTDAQGQAMFDFDTEQSFGIVRLELDIDAYFSTLGVKPVYPNISIVCRLPDQVHNRLVKLIVTPSTYVVSVES